MVEHSLATEGSVAKVRWADLRSNTKPQRRRAVRCHIGANEEIVAKTLAQQTNRFQLKR